MTVVNQNVVGHFDDLLSTYTKINDLTRYYQYITQNISDAKTKMSTISSRVEWKNVARIWGVIFSCAAILSLLLVLCGVRTVVAYVVLLVFLPALLAVTLRYLYLWRLIPSAKKRYDETTDKARKECMGVYEKLSIQRQNLELLSHGLDDDCCNPLAVYIMRQATQDGSCQNIFQAQQYFLDRKARLAEQQDDEDAVHALEQLASARIEASEQQAFLYNLDEAVTTLLKA